MLKYLIRRLNDACAFVGNVVRNAWQHLLNQPSCADAAADLVTDVVQICCRNWIVVGFVRYVVQGLAALIRDVIGSRHRDDALPWQLA